MRDVVTAIPEPAVLAVHLGDGPSTGVGRAIVGRAVVDLDLATEQQARDDLSALCHAPGPAPWVLLLLGPRIFVDVRGLDVLLEANDQAAAAGRSFLVVLPPRPLVRMVTLLDLASRLHLADSMVEAAALVGAPGPEGGRRAD